MLFGGLSGVELGGMGGLLLGILGELCLENTFARRIGGTLLG